MRFRLIRHGLVESTNERALEAVAAGEARHGDVHVAEGQTRGRGRLGRAWESAAGEGLYMSLVLLPPPPPLSPVALTMASALAVLRAVRALGLAQAALDWPNDVVVGASKLCGVLVESRGLDPLRPHYVIGVGLNVLQRNFSPELQAERAVTSLALQEIACTVERARDALLETFESEIERLSGDPEGLARDFLASTGWEGVDVRIGVGERVFEGRLVELSPARGICIARPDGSRQRMAVEHVRSLTLLSTRPARRTDL